MIDVVIDAGIYGVREDGDGLAYDHKSSSVMQLNNGMVLYLVIKLFSIGLFIMIK